jgi:hypothetical protein
VTQVAPGFNSITNLAHVHGEAVSKKHVNIRLCGKSVDGWPLTGVMLHEPGAAAGAGRPCDVITRWNASSK